MGAPGDSDAADGLLRFLKTRRPPEELRIALAVIREFKPFESRDEWAMPFSLWTRLEQLEDYLRLLIGDGADEVTDEAAKAYLGADGR